MHFLTLLFVALAQLDLVLSQYFICFASAGPQSVGIYSDFHPPAGGPKEDPGFIYNPPKGKPILKPIVAFLCKSKNTPIDEKDDKELFSTTEKPKYFNITPSRNYLRQGIELCQYAANNYPITSPKRFDLDPIMSRYSCSKNGLSNIKIHGNMLIAQGLIFHKIDNDVTITFSTSNFADLKTYPFQVTDTVEVIKWEVQPPKIFKVDEPLNIKLKLTNNKGEVVTFGRDANMLVEVDIPMEYKRFTDSADAGHLVTDSLFSLSGDKAVKSLNDVVLRDESKDGFVEFKFIQLHQTTTSLRLNATLRSRSMYSEGFNKSKLSCKTTTQFAGEYKKKMISFYKCTSIDRNALSTEFKTSGQEANAVIVEVDVHDSNKTAQTATNLKFRLNQIITFYVKIVNSKNIIVSEGEASSTIVVPVLRGANCAYGTESKHAIDGIATFQISVCEIAKQVVVQFNSTKLKKFSASITFEVTGNIHLGIFDSWLPSSTGPRNALGHLRSEFANLAVEHLNKGDYKFKKLPRGNIKVILHSFNTKNDYNIAYDELTRYIAENWGFPERRFLGILGFGNNSILHQMKPLLQSYEIPVISLTETRKEFLAQFSGTHDIINNLNWNDLTYYKIMTLILNSRDWNKIVIVHSKRFHAGKLISELLMKNITIEHQIIVSASDSWTPSEKKEISKSLKLIKDSKNKIILSVLHPSQQAKLNRILLENEVSSNKGYQWILLLEEDIYHINWEEYEPDCKEEPPCESFMEGMLLVSASYNSNQKAEEIFASMKIDFNKNGKTLSLSNKARGEVSLAYDGVLMFLYALDYQIQEKIGTNASSLTKSIRQISVEGLTGQIKLTANGTRDGFVGLLKTVSKSDSKTNQKSNFHWIIYSHLWKLPGSKPRHRRSTATNSKAILVEVPDQSSNVKPETESESPDSNETGNALLRYYLSTESSMTLYQTDVILQPLVLRTESTLRVTSCDCGALISPIHSNNYERGYCISDGVCRCKTIGEIIPESYHDEKKNDLIGWVGSRCEIPLCRFCFHGTCINPETCDCKTGYKGSACNESICRSCSEDHGRCTAPDRCECNFGYIGAKCDLSLFLVILGVLLALLLFLIFSLCFYKLSTWRRKRRAIFQVDWLVWWGDVTELSDDTSGKPDARGDASIRKISVKDTTKVWTAQPVVIWKGEKYNIQKFNRPTLDLSSVKIRNEFLTLKNVRHPNLILFVGACLSSPNVCLLTELMPKGTLHQVLVSTTFHVTWHFKFSFLRDICNGMSFLHKSQIHSHGQLKSTTCLVDNKWTCKVSGFGVPTMRQENKELTTDMLSQMLWTAPELLKEVYTASDIGQGTQEGDVFSFGIIVSECCTHTLPYTKELEILSLEEIIRLLKDFKHPTNKGIKQLLGVHHYDTRKPLRPSVDETEYPFEYKQKQGLKDLIRISTDEESSGRPQFSQILWMLQTMNPMKGGLVENLVDMLERYTLQMEDTIINKLQEIAEQKHRTEDYVNRLLPPTIALHMKEGKPVPPQKHTQVTIFFSDIVGFTALSKQISPMDVVTLLNDLYTTFDDIIDRFEVYKVETVGDAYCVAGGIPDPNPKHASEIATMSLHIISAVSQFVIRPMPGKKLQVRIGIHTGACVAGVLGQKKPRYCIFGEDVVIAQNMESGGLPQNIHISQKVKDHLDKTKLFKIVRREKLVNIDPVGEMQTYWLVGKTKFKEPLPAFEQIESPTPSDKVLFKTASPTQFSGSSHAMGRPSQSREEWRDLVSEMRRRASSLDKTESGGPKRKDSLNSE